MKCICPMSYISRQSHFPHIVKYWVKYLASVHIGRLVHTLLTDFKETYAAHKNFMNGFASRRFDPYGGIIYTVRCQ